ncbi:fasciclin-3-like isoform X2 [Toxorhynchites rutilus septentrionalis]|uniref:fasciclin-3-like isoform X2 n=1 Tax=Toxorhynchites rutilus septentrionalis TaxID=329112 RepID=UPI0024789CC3|nr:fasciclin-3-like isoform X2 [Toxorhynchites rutilus septentrionalis]
MIKLMLNILQLIVACVAVEVITEPKSLIVSVGQQNVNLSCKTPERQPIDFCIVNVPGVKAPFASSERLPAPVEGITFFGDGWKKGSCGVTLASVKPENDGSFECTISIRGQRHKGLIDIVVQVSPEPPVIEISRAIDHSDGTFNYGQPLIARCISRNDWPGAKLSWYLNDTQITDGLGAVFSEKVGRQVIVQQFFRKSIAIEDNRKRLVCRAEHGSYPRGYSEVSLSIKLRKSSDKNVVNDKTAVGATVMQFPKPQLIPSSDTEMIKDAFIAGTDAVLNCIVRNGTGDVKFIWFLDDHLIYEGLSALFVSQDDKGNVSVAQILKRKMELEDNGKSLVCKARSSRWTNETRLKFTITQWSK